MFKGNNKDTGTTSSAPPKNVRKLQKTFGFLTFSGSVEDVVLVSLLLTSTYFKPFSDVSIDDFEQANSCWGTSAKVALECFVDTIDEYLITIRTIYFQVQLSLFLFNSRLGV